MGGGKSTENKSTHLLKRPNAAGRGVNAEVREMILASIYRYIKSPPPDVGIIDQFDGFVFEGSGR